MQLEKVDLNGLSVVTGYGNGGFRVAGSRYKGSLLLFGEELHYWPVTSIEEVTLDSLAPLLDGLAEAPDLLLFGTGSRAALLSPDLANELRGKGLGVECMDTGAACRTYSFLTMEGRRVAGALIAV